MNGKSKEILDELKSVLSGKTIDALFPPLVFVIINGLLGLEVASVISILTAVGFGVRRIFRKQDLKYALGGLLGVLVAVGFAYLSGNASNFFLPKIISGTFMVLLSLGTLLIGKPLAAWLSHLTRGWPMDWFMRKDVKPAYREVTILWTILLAFRLIIQILLFRGRNLSQMFWVNTLMGTPATIIILILSYIYGIWRLQRLEGPGVDEYMQGKEKPWRGQRKGF
ncbi:DUF3159 domain-containing protein [Proteiniclasticum sp. SCR006]|uniref:DUF3159 domain-containing protein n=1 Tax=Proteiniclasticum aestuarii TaxID=2817862 RepID=A0A939KKB0_9CLOT|nr:DUF3159 domain-containing protein [Proteiniclasticum aestuarii]MBO1266038.1 DUF3159 domain-containing protein [Proteiniclasticum aestuarii]